MKREVQKLKKGSRYIYINITQRRITDQKNSQIKNAA